MYKKIENREGLIKSEKSGAILLTDIQKRDEYLQKKSLFDAKRIMEKDINMTDTRISNLENDMNEIIKIINKLN